MRNSTSLLTPVLLAFALAAVPAYAIAKGANGECHGKSGHGYSSMSMGMIGPQIRDKLQLNAAQEKTWQDIEANAKTLHTQKRDERAKLKEAFREELTKPEPDLVKLSGLRESMHTSGQQARNEIEKQQLDFYAGLSAEQKAVVKTALLERLEHKGAKHKGGEQKI